MNDSKKAFLVIGGVGISGGMCLMILIGALLFAAGRSKMPPFDLDHIEAPAGYNWLQSNALALEISMTEYEFIDIGVKKIARPKNAKVGDMEFVTHLGSKVWYPHRIEAQR